MTIYLGRFHHLVLMEIKYCEHAPDWCMSALLVGLFIHETVVQEYAYFSSLYNNESTGRQVLLPPMG